MQGKQLTVLGIFAHPDDELGVGGCFAHYQRTGHKAWVACATRGDGVDAKISDPSFATPETLGQVRSAELTCACETLGIGAPFFLEMQDGEVDALDVEEAAQRVLAVMRTVRPDVLVTHGPEGGYGHPDHIAVYRFVTRAWELSANEAHVPSKLYYTAFPRSVLARVPQLAERRADVRGQQLGFIGVEDSLITTLVDIAPYIDLKDQARQCHRTQFPVTADGKPSSGFFAGIPEEERRAFMSRERFVRAQTRGLDGLPATGEDDLFAGLRE